MKKSKVSVLLPVYNGSQYLSETIHSILNQTYSDFEIIIIDDASMDNSVDIINNFNNKKIILRQNDSNLGQAESENIGLRIARGTYIARIDQDDLMMPDRLEKQVQFLDSHPDIAAVGSQVYCIDSSGKSIKKIMWPVGFEANLFYIITGNVPVGDPAVMYRKEMVQNLGGYNEQYVPSEDYYLWLQMYLKGYKCDNIKDFLTTYRLHSLQTSIVRKNTQLEKHNLAFTNFYKSLAKVSVDPKLIIQYLNILRGKEKFNQNNIGSSFRIFFTLLNNLTVIYKLDQNSRRKIYKSFLFSIDNNMNAKKIIDLIILSINNDIFHLDLIKPLWNIFTNRT